MMLPDISTPRQLVSTAPAWQRVGAGYCSWLLLLLLCCPGVQVL
jgi:hypothetical protein